MAHAYSLINHIHVKRGQPQGCFNSCRAGSITLAQHDGLCILTICPNNCSLLCLINKLTGGSDVQYQTSTSAICKVQGCTGDGPGLAAMQYLAHGFGDVHNSGWNAFHQYNCRISSPEGGHGHSELVHC
jgi:hypothetical protein